MKKVVVKWRSPRLWSLMKKDGDFIVIKPGVSQISMSDYEFIKDMEIVKERVEKKTMENDQVVSTLEFILPGNDDSKGANNDNGEDDDTESIISGMSAADAKSLVLETFSTELLREWKEVETRASVVKAIDKKLEEIDAERNASSDDE